jgi:hypothetical protein
MLPLGYHIIFGTFHLVYSKTFHSRVSPIIFSLPGARNPPKLDQDLQKLKASGKMGCGTYEIFDLNLKSLKSVEAFAKKISDKYAAINVLVNNGKKPSVVVSVSFVLTRMNQLYLLQLASCSETARRPRTVTSPSLPSTTLATFFSRTCSSTRSRERAQGTTTRGSSTCPRARSTTEPTLTLTIYRASEYIFYFQCVRALLKMQHNLARTSCANHMSGAIILYFQEVLQS